MKTSQSRVSFTGIRMLQILFMGVPMIRKKNFLLVLITLFLMPSLSFAGTLFQEDFEDSNFSARGWYDGTYKTNAVTTSQYQNGTHSYECHFTQGSNYCAGGDPRRHLFTATDTLYISYWMKLSSNWVGSGDTFHPHIIMFMSTLNAAYDGLASSRLTGYLELNANKLRGGFQDGQNINMSSLNVNLCSTNENRASFGCNGTCFNDKWDGAAGCYDLSGAPDHIYTNSLLITAAPTMSLNTWHHIEGYYQMNSISGGKGQNNGVYQMWLDGTMVVNYTDLIYRTAQNPTAQWNQFVIAPYMATNLGGSPADQYFWLDDLTVATSRASQDPVAPSPPANLRVN